MEKECVIGIDVGTMETKAVVFDREGQELGSSSREIAIYFPHQGWVEQDLEEMWEKTASCIKDSVVDAGAKPGDVRCISVTGQRETVCPVDREGRPLYHAISWQDTRGWDICKKLKEDFGMNQIYSITGLPVNSMPSASKIAWMKENEPRIYGKAWKFIGVVDYTAYKLSGELKTDYSNANRTLLFDLRKKKWADEILEFLNIDKDKLLDLIPSGTDMGDLTPSAAQRTGLDKKTRVVYGGGDQQCSALGIGVVKPKRTSCILGTCTNIEAFSDQIPFDPKMSLQAQLHVIPQAYLSEGGIGTSGVIYRWFRDNFASMEMEVGKYLQKDPYALLDDEASAIKPGSEGLLLIPYFSGSLFPYWNAEDRGLLIGLTLRHSRAHIIRSILEGVAFEYRRMADEAERVSNVKVENVRFMGGGARSRLWTKIFVDVLGVEGQVPLVTETGAFGAALLGMVSLNWHHDAVEAAERFIRIGEPITPEQATHESYSRFYKIYRDLYGRVQDLVNNLSRTSAA